MKLSREISSFLILSNPQHDFTEFITTFGDLVVDGYMIANQFDFRVWKGCVTQVNKSREDKNGSIARSFHELRNKIIYKIYDNAQNRGHNNTGLYSI